MVNKNLITGKKYEDRELAAKTCFESTTIEIETPQTLILLLGSKEEMVLLKALSGLDKFAGKHEQNAKALHEEEILKALTPLIDHQNIYIKRFATKLLAELCFVRAVVDNLLEHYQGLLLKIMTLLHEVNDSFVKEFSASIIAELTKTKIGYDQFIETNMIQILIPLLSSTDPDIQYNCLKIILNIISQPNDKTILTDDSSFTVKHFLNLLLSEYVAIQNITLDILYLLTEQTKMNPVPKMVQDGGGVIKLLSIVKNYEWKDIHGKALDVLGNIYNDPNIAQNFLREGVTSLFGYVEFVTDPQLLRRAVEVIAKIAETPLGRKVLSDSGFISKLQSKLADHNHGVCSAVCHTVANLSRDFSALRQLTDLPTVDDLLKVVEDEERPWTTRGEALNALCEIMKRDSDSCINVANFFEKGFIEKIINDFDEKAPLQAAIAAVNCIITLEGYGDLKEKIVNESLISSLLHCFKEFPEDTSLLKLAACEALCGLLSNPRTRDFLHNQEALAVVWPSITKHPNNVAFLQSAATFVHLCVSNDHRFTSALLGLGVLNWLLSQRSLRNDCPAWEMALETIFSHFLPIKFAFTGRLEMTDITGDGFYITRIPLNREQLETNMFPVLDNLITDNCCSIWTIYLVNTGECDLLKNKNSFLDSSKLEKSPINSLEKEGRKPTVNSLDKDIKKLNVKSSEKERKRSTLISMDGDRKISTVQSDNSQLSIFSNREKVLSPDLYLLKYIESLKELFNENGFSTEPSKRSQRVLDGNITQEKTRLLGQFVAKQMSGIEQNDVCTNHMLDLHLNELMMELSDDIIPMGYLRVGLHLERALLFKVLADRVGLPCSLVRGSSPHRRGWVEVCLPHLPPAPHPAYPDHLLRPSHVVDLMHDPGALLQLGSYEANQYCGLL